jgi:hypothetical protein
MGRPWGVYDQNKAQRCFSTKFKKIKGTNNVQVLDEDCLNFRKKYSPKGKILTIFGTV